MTRAEELSKEISTAVLSKVALNYKTATIQQMNDMVASVIAAKLEPLVSDAEQLSMTVKDTHRWHNPLSERILSIASKYHEESEATNEQ